MSEIAEVATVVTSMGKTGIGGSSRTVLFGFIVSAAAADVTVTIDDGSINRIVYVMDISIVGLSQSILLPAPIKITGTMNVTVAGVGGTATFFYGK